jgi:hypothetical protein
MEAQLLTKTTHPPCSPDLASSHFFLFGDVKRRLTGCSFDSVDERLGAIHEIVGVVKAKTSNRRFANG